MANSKCKNCNDPATGHFRRFMEDNYRCCYCPCTDYIPTANLEYLEWRYDQKEKV